LTKRGHEIVSTQKPHAPGGIPQRKLLGGPMRSAKPNAVSTTTAEMKKGANERQRSEPPRSGLVQHQAQQPAGLRSLQSIRNPHAPPDCCSNTFGGLHSN